MVIRSIKEKKTERFFIQGRKDKKLKWGGVSRIAKRKLDMLQYAHNLKDLKAPPGNCLERLKGNLKEYYSIRINDQWRIIFKWDNQPYDVSVVDYH